MVASYDVFKVFYSWQSDLPNKTNRTLIQNALEKACHSLKSDGGVIAEAVVDRDTLGLSGAPDINDAILTKIRDSDAFVADVSLINSGRDRLTPKGGMSSQLIRAVRDFWHSNNKQNTTRPCPNPNVLTELGYAMAHLGNEALVLIVNTYYGTLDDLPFDLRSLRKLAYRAGPTDDLPKIREQLSRDVASAIKSIADVVRGDPVDTLLHERTQQVAGQARAFFTELGRASDKLSRELAESELLTRIESMTKEECAEICRLVDPMAPRRL